MVFFSKVPACLDTRTISEYYNITISDMVCSGYAPSWGEVGMLAQMLEYLSEGLNCFSSKLVNLSPLSSA